MIKNEKTREGFSLVEMIVVIVIMAILVGVTALGIGMLNSVDAKDAAYGLEGSLTKLKSMNEAGSKAVWLHVYLKDGKYYRIFTDSSSAASPDGTEKEIGDSSLHLKAVYDVRSKTGQVCPDREVNLSESGISEIVIGISKKDGSFRFEKVSGSDEKEAVREIEVKTDGSSTGYRLCMVTETGKHFVEVI